MIPPPPHTLLSAFLLFSSISARHLKGRFTELEFLISSVRTVAHVWGYGLFAAHNFKRDVRQARSENTKVILCLKWWQQLPAQKIFGTKKADPVSGAVGEECVFTADWCTLGRVVAGCKLEQRRVVVLSWQRRQQPQDFLGSVAALSASNPLAPYSLSFLPATWEPMTKELKLHRRHYRK